MIRHMLTAAALLATPLGPALAKDEGGGLTIYSIPPAAQYDHHNNAFTVRVREVGGEWRDLYEYRVMVDLNDPQPATMVSFDMAGPVEVAVQKNNGDVRRVEVRPDSKGVRARLVGRTAYMRLDRPQDISIEFDGDRLHNLHLFASPVESKVPDRDAPGVMWFGPGMHVPPNGGKTFDIPSGTTVYVAGGALLRGAINVSNAHDVKILGRGIIDEPVEGVIIANSRNVLIDGLIIRNSGHYSVLCGQSHNIVIRNFRAISSAKWSDGLDFMGCSDVVIDNVFMRNSDDTVAIYADRKGFQGDARNFTVTNSTLWADLAHPVNIGLHGNDKEPRVLENLTFRNIDVLLHQEDDRNYQGVLAISNSDNNLVRNVVFEDIRIDTILEGMLFNFRALFNDKYSLAPGRGIENVTVRNVHFKGGTIINVPVIAGYSDDRRVRNIVIDNVSVAGKRLKRADIDIGPWADDIVVK
jgi:hypothetical protein